ncbi:MAG: hypothetical protein ACRBEQ_04590 [Hyphomonas sp.]
MKLFTGLTLSSVMIAGAACSEPAAPDVEQSAVTSTETTQSVQLAEPEGSFNLSLPESLGESDTSSGLNLSFGEPSNNNLLTGQEGFGEADFGSVPDIDIDVDVEPTPANDDDLIRLPSPN